VGKRTCDLAFVSLCYGRSREEICTGYAMAASSQMQYDYKQTNKQIHVMEKMFIVYSRDDESLFKNPNHHLETQKYTHGHSANKSPPKI
jgi:hypothetical protein